MLSISTPDISWRPAAANHLVVVSAGATGAVVPAAVAGAGTAQHACQ